MHDMRDRFGELGIPFGIVAGKVIFLIGIQSPLAVLAK